MLNIFDTGHVWVPEMERAAVLRNFPVRKLKRGASAQDGVGFFVPRQFGEKELMEDKFWAEELIEGKQHFVQDTKQIRMYEDKIAQAFDFFTLMPPTRVAFTLFQALQAFEHTPPPVVSKSAYGSASNNVRLLNSRTEMYAEILQAFGEGIRSRRGAGVDVLQKGYVLWQEFIPHEWTWRVTIVGTKLHVYKRFNYPDRPMAAPSCVVRTQPVEMCEEVESLLDFSKLVFNAIGTKWCAIDVLKDTSGNWKLLETSLAWARGDDPAGNAKFYETKHSLNTQFDLLLDEIEAGVFG